MCRGILDCTRTTVAAPWSCCLTVMLQDQNLAADFLWEISIFFSCIVFSPHWWKTCMLGYWQLYVDWMSVWVNNSVSCVLLWTDDLSRVHPTTHPVATGDRHQLSFTLHKKVCKENRWMKHFQVPLNVNSNNFVFAHACVAAFVFVFCLLKTSKEAFRGTKTEPNVDSENIFSSG